MFSSTGDTLFIFNQLMRLMEESMKKNPTHKVLEDSSIVIPVDNVAEVVDEFSKPNPDLGSVAIECATLLHSTDLLQTIKTLQKDVGADALL